MYEYANRLADLGYSVHITYPIKTRFMKYRFPYFIRLIMSYIEGFRTYNWFQFNPNITRSYIKEVKNKYFSESDIILATWWSTAYDVGLLYEKKGKKINLIQGYEDWEGHVDLLHKSYNMKGITNVVVASYLEEIVKKYTSNRTVLIPNAIDTEVYKVKQSIEQRKAFRVCMLYSIQEIKGSHYGLKALNIVKQNYPELKVDLFGICHKPEHLPNWITYYRNHNDLTEIYNRNAIFISNSLTEGFGLVSVEALACGCALVCTDISGHREYAINEETALLVPVKNPEVMAEKVMFLIENNNYRIRLAKDGNSYVQNFSWDKAVKKMDNLIKELLQD